MEKETFTRELSQLYHNSAIQNGVVPKH